MTKTLGPNFGNEVIAAGLGGLPFSWGPTSDDMNTEALTPAQITTLQAVIAAHSSAKAFVPQTMTSRQARLALLSAGLLDKVSAAVNAAGGETLITWEYATEFSRYDPIILGIGEGLGLTPDQLDALFVQGATL